MNKRVFLSCIALLSLISLAVAPVLAATMSSTVACPSTCSCLLPEEARKIGSPGICGVREQVCARDSQQNEKYCYEKPLTTTKVPQLILTARTFVATTPTTIPPQKCSSGCICRNSADGMAAGLQYCGGKATVCGYSHSTPLFCFSPVTTPGTTPPVAGAGSTATTPTTTRAPCPSGCACLAPDKADAVGFSRCNGMSDACSYDPLGRPMYCYLADRVTAASPVPADNAPVDFPQQLPSDEAPPDIPAHPPSDEAPPDVPQRQSDGAPPDAPEDGTAPKADGTFFSAIGTFFASLLGTATGSTSSQSPTQQRVPCNGIMTDVLWDPENCGSCGMICSSGRCTAGQCANETRYATGCGPASITCNGTCTYYLSDNANCGSCGHSCNSTEACCNGRCRDIMSDFHRCGSCTHECSSHQVCQNGECACSFGTVSCDIHRSECIDLQTDPLHCGECRNACSRGQECQDGHCVCHSGTECGGECVYTEIDRDNCGGCNRPCYDPTPECCNGQCTSLLWDENNCGDCRHTCDMETGRCCSGVCADITSDEQNCGECGNACRTGETCCDGVCVNSQSDEQNCGECGRTCSSGQQCCDGGCTSLNAVKHCGSCDRYCPDTFFCYEGKACCFGPIAWICHPRLGG